MNEKASVSKELNAKHKKGFGLRLCRPLISHAPLRCPGLDVAGGDRVQIRYYRKNNTRPISASAPVMKVKRLELQMLTGLR